MFVIQDRSRRAAPRFPVQPGCSGPDAGDRQYFAETVNRNCLGADLMNV